MSFVGRSSTVAARAVQTVCKRGAATGPVVAGTKVPRSKYIVGMTERTVSPYESKIVMPLFDHAATKTMRRVSENFFDLLPAILVAGFTYTYFVNGIRENEEASRYFNKD